MVSVGDQQKNRQLQAKGKRGFSLTKKRKASSAILWCLQVSASFFLHRGNTHSPILSQSIHLRGLYVACQPSPPVLTVVIMSCFSFSNLHFLSGALIDVFATLHSVRFPPGGRWFAGNRKTSSRRKDVCMALSAVH